MYHGPLLGRLPRYFCLVQDTRLEEFFFRVADLPALVLHCAIVGRHAGYDPPLDLDFRPQGPPVLQLTQPLPLFWLNHLFKLPLLFFATFLTNVVVFSSNFAATDHMPRSIRAILRHGFSHFLVASVLLRRLLFLFGYHFLQDQYRAVSLSLAVSHLWRARKEARLFGLDFLIRILGSPKRTIFS